MVNVKNRVQIPEAEEGELEDDDDERIEDDDSCLYEMPGQMCVRRPAPGFVWKVFTLRLAMRIVLWGRRRWNGGWMEN